MAYPGYGGYGGPMPGMPAQGMPPQGMPMGGPMGGPMPGHMGGPMGGAPPQGGYSPYGGGYPGSFGAQPPAANDPMWGYFTAIAGQDGEIDAEELQRCLTQSGFSGSYTPFSMETCRIMIAMLDRDFTGKMGFNEFKELFTALNGWKQNFMMFDRDHSGTVEPHEMSQAITAMEEPHPLLQSFWKLWPITGAPGAVAGYRVSPQALNAIIKRYNKGGRIFFDDYVACCVKLRALTDNFRRRDTMQQGSVTFQYDDFILCTMAI
ncbi:grancalcin isoform X2 [Amphiprion ocellaris]|uniref:grancalcin isoform X2 n=1 Tax=Amphiprion ocellaris TaxID=80972 RepID=UPI002410F834|nr:grancalcin isoform X2 [Amphiprion ocellaris]